MDEYHGATEEDKTRIMKEWEEEQIRKELEGDKENKENEKKRISKKIKIMIKYMI